MWEVSNTGNKQFFTQLDENEFVFIQFYSTSKKTNQLLKILNSGLEADLDLEDYLDEEGFQFTMNTINIDDYSQLEIEAIIRGFYSSSSEVYERPDANQIIAECIFNTEL